MTTLTMKLFPSAPVHDTFLRHQQIHLTSRTQRHRRFDFSLQVSPSNDDSKNITSTINMESSSEEEEVHKIVDGMDFGELCNEFECISSPSVESTARQLARDILEMRQRNRALGTFSVSVKYKDPVRSFTGREKYKRPLWVTDALEKPSVTVQEMVMLSTSVLNIRWTLRGKSKSLSIGGDVMVKVTSRFTLNQISGQVIEHEELWDLSDSSAIAKAFFWSSRRLYATVEAAKDTTENLKNSAKRFSPEKENVEIYPDPSGDPAKFFQQDDGFQRDVYQIGLFLAVVYLVVQFLKTTL
ncbi:hypothetical protein C5167_015153 [Papaver somniferum]|uniref:AT1G65230-like protein n=1 Tax=Papaver somniferum TaxID=3469 RepID=A0A4Y7J9L7_PAPSO|nr:uncharacterized protein LOC113358219 [Papaver somniferum]RZC56305.1 hypothetical protein C5167_015153 [Papaver somniferum]